MKTFIQSKFLAAIITPFIIDFKILDYDFLTKALLCLVILGMVFLLAMLYKSLKKLKYFSKEKTENGKEWINHKLNDFDDEQLKILIKRVNKSNKNDKQVETEN